MVLNFKDSIGYNQMKIKSVAKLLNEANRTNFTLRLAAADDKPFGDFVDYDSKNSLKDIVSLKIVSNPFGEADHELANRYMGNHIFD